MGRARRRKGCRRLPCPSKMGRWDSSFDRLARARLKLRTVVADAFSRSPSCVAGSTKLKEPLVMTVSAKCYYALRAIYALSEYRGTAPLKANEIAERQHIPIKFLEAILSQLKGEASSTAVEGRRGATCWLGRRKN